MPLTKVYVDKHVC